MRTIKLFLTNGCKHSQIVLPQNRNKSTKTALVRRLLQLKIVCGILSIILITKIHLILNLYVWLPNKLKKKTMVIIDYLTLLCKKGWIRIVHIIIV